MKAFFERNKPVFTIGIVTLIVFLGLIFFYAFKSHNNLTKLNKLGNESPYNVTEEEIIQEQEDKQEIENAQIQAQEEKKIEIDSTLGTVNIDFTKYGWVPRLATAVKDQKVVWINKTDQDIFFRQRTPTYDALSELMKIEPGKSFEFRVSEVGDWNYDESLSNFFATVRVTNEAQ